jgi:hypothetical protein
MPELKNWVLIIPKDGDATRSFDMQLTNKAGVVSNVTFTGTFDEKTRGEVQLAIGTAVPASLGLPKGSHVVFRR